MRGLSGSCVDHGLKVAHEDAGGGIRGDACAGTRAWTAARCGSCPCRGGWARWTPDPARPPRWAWRRAWMSARRSARERSSASRSAAAWRRSSPCSGTSWRSGPWLCCRSCA
eukprot:129283-Hanusia_phi.AAC.2